MTKRLTKKLLRDAAALLAPGGENESFEGDAEEYQYMCYAVSAAAGLDRLEDEGDIPAAFHRLLIKHGVSSGGGLNGLHQPFELKGTPESQALRFIFLHLLAESL